ncbi:anti-sigma factor RsbA family regulatory protein [Actinomadura sp. 9N407]|uniref:anti-sigma factor RsbA family regulatory protein n=1 Tax=Actinomadura sp. 9N407 TaxID=3375154 RepID=UPI0037B72250
MSAGVDGSISHLGSFLHQASVYGSDADFLAMALPFVQEGLDAGDQVLVASTAVNIDLIGGALGDRGDEAEFAETGSFGRRPPQRVAGFHRYWCRARRRGGRVRVLAEPVWTDRAERDVADWHRVESGLNVALAGTDMWMICPYDARMVPAAILAEARHTHPSMVVGRESRDCPEYTDPVAYARERDAAAPLPAPCEDAPEFVFADDLRPLRRFVADRAAVLGMADPADAATAAGEVGTYLSQVGGPAQVRLWLEPDAVVCDFHQESGRIADPFAGFRPPDLRPRPGDELWLARQLSERLEIRSTGEGCTVRLFWRPPRSVERYAPRG